MLTQQAITIKDIYSELNIDDETKISYKKNRKITKEIKHIVVLVKDEDDYENFKNNHPNTKNKKYHIFKDKYFAIGFTIKSFKETFNAYLNPEYTEIKRLLRVNLNPEYTGI